MKRFLAMSILVFIAGFIGNAHAPDVQKFNVYVNVKCDDVNTKSLFERHIKRQLRALMDVNIISEIETKSDELFPYYKLRLTVVVQQGIFAAAFVFDEHFYRSTAFDELGEAMKEKSYDCSRQLYRIILETVVDTSLVYLYKAGVLTGKHEDIPSTCVDLIADIDTNVLEKAREKM